MTREFIVLIVGVSALGFLVVGGTVLKSALRRRWRASRMYSSVDYSDESVGDLVAQAALSSLFDASTTPDVAMSSAGDVPSPPGGDGGGFAAPDSAPGSAGGWFSGGDGDVTW